MAGPGMRRTGPAGTKVGAIVFCGGRQLMTRTFSAALGGVLAVAASGGAGATGQVQHGAANGPAVIVSCFRGPWQEVIWDRPNPVFVDSLVAAGYSFPEAHAIAERVCRDPDTVGRPDDAAAVMRRILAESPPRN